MGRARNAWALAKVLLGAAAFGAWMGYVTATPDSYLAFVLGCMVLAGCMESVF